MLALEEALERILSAVPAPTVERVALGAATSRVLCERIVAPIDLPVFDNSAMDGYAVRAADVASARADSPVRLRVAGRVPAGETFPGEVIAGACVRLFTGSPLPRGADAVVMQEDTRLESNEVLILEPARPWENVRLRGEDVKRGATLAETGMTLSAGRISVLTAVGLTDVNVGRQPIAGLLATGSELREPGQSLGPGQIYESNRAGLASLLRRAGAPPRIFPLVPDTLAATGQVLVEAFSECDAVITTGGVSVGEMDFLKQAFDQMGGNLQFWKVAIRPGRPFVFGRYQEKLLFGLPGNPVSALVTFLLLVRPALLRWQGAAILSLPTHPGVAVDPLVNDGPRRHFLRVKIDPTGRVSSAGLQASHALGSLAEANGLVDLPPQTVIPGGTIVQVLRLEF